jgi:hypothetical protein
MPRGRPKQPPEPTATAQGQANGAAKTKGGRINKLDCVRQALAELGNDAQPKDIQGFLKRKFGLDMNTKFISTYKGSILRGAAKKGGVVRRPSARVSSPPKAVLKVGAVNGGISVEDIRAVKELVGRIGADSVRELAELLAQ